MSMQYSPSGSWLSNETMTIYRHDDLMNPRRDAYLVVTHNVQLAYMQGVKPGNAHVTAVVDDFGDLVRVAA